MLLLLKLCIVVYGRINNVSNVVVLCDVVLLIFFLNVKGMMFLKVFIIELFFCLDDWDIYFIIFS